MSGPIERKEQLSKLNWSSPNRKYSNRSPGSGQAWRSSRNCSVLGSWEDYLRIPGVGRVGVLNARFPNNVDSKSIKRQLVTQLVYKLRSV